MAKSTCASVAIVDAIVKSTSGQPLPHISSTHPQRRIGWNTGWSERLRRPPRWLGSIDGNLPGEASEVCMRHMSGAQQRVCVQKCRGDLCALDAQEHAGDCAED